MTCTCSGDWTLASLFDGIAGFPRAFATAGVRTVATVEIDKAAAGVAAHHYPDAAHFANVTKVTADDLIAAGFCSVHGVLTAGWPCTDLSLAGLRLGLGGARSGLVGEVFRLLLSVQPRRFVLENVPGLLSSVCPCVGGGICDRADCAAGSHTVRGGSCGRRSRGGKLTGPGRCMAFHGGGMGTVLRRLGECGYGLAYRVLDAQHFGVPQRRRRVVIVGHLGDAAGPVEVLLEPESGGRHPASRRTAGARPAGIAEGGAEIGGNSEIAPTLQGGGRRGFRIDAETAAGGGLVTTSLTRTSLTGTDDNSAQGGHLVAVEPEVWQQQGSKLQPMGTMRRGNGNVTGGVPFLATTITARNGKGPDSEATTTLITHPLTSEGADASEDGTGRGTPLVPVAYALRADPAGVGQGHNTNFVPVAFGHTNGIDVQASTDVAPTMRAGHGVGGGSVASATAVRRLTPVECERLQGFPDDWTAKRVDLTVSDNRWVATGKGVIEQADSARYRQLGNSIAGPVFEWVAQRMFGKLSSDRSRGNAQS